jgi:hypothetical protein
MNHQHANINKELKVFCLENEVDDCLDTDYVESYHEILLAKRNRTINFQNHILDGHYLEFLNLLSKHKVRFIVVGSFAVAYYSKDRLIGDLDLWVSHENDNIVRVRDTLIDFNAWQFNQRLNCNSLFNNMVFQIGKPPHRIDILIKMRNLNFDNCASRCNIYHKEDISLPIMSKEDLILSKRISGRSKDILDIQLLSS